MLIVVLNPEVVIIIPEIVIIKFNKLQTSQIRVGGSQGSKTWFLSPQESILSVSLSSKKCFQPNPFSFPFPARWRIYWGKQGPISNNISSAPVRPPPGFFACTGFESERKNTKRTPFLIILGRGRGEARDARQRAYQRQREKEGGGSEREKAEVRISSEAEVMTQHMRS